MRLPPELRRALTMLVSNEVRRSELQLGRIDEFRAYKQLKKTIVEEYAGLLEYIQDGLLDDYLKKQVKEYVDKTQVDYRPHPLNGDAEEVPDILRKETRQRAFVRVDYGDKMLPKRVAGLSDTEHGRVAEQRNQKILELVRPRDWHLAVKAWAEQNNITDAVVQELFDIGPPDENS